MNELATLVIGFIVGMGFNAWIGKTQFNELKAALDQARNDKRRAEAKIMEYGNSLKY